MIVRDKHLVDVLSLSPSFIPSLLPSLPPSPAPSFHPPQLENNKQSWVRGARAPISLSSPFSSISRVKSTVYQHGLPLRKYMSAFYSELFMGWSGTPHDSNLLKFPPKSECKETARGRTRVLVISLLQLLRRSERRSNGKRMLLVTARASCSKGIPFTRKWRDEHALVWHIWQCWRFNLGLGFRL